MTTATPASDLIRAQRKAPLENEDVAPILSIGFRPFFLLATLSAIALVPAWLWVLERGNLSPYWAGSAWHAHEMLFGFTTAVIAGFLLTAASNWTQRPTATGPLLAGLAVLWLLGRLLPFLSTAPLLVAGVDFAFLLTLLAVLSRSLIRARNRKNYGFIGLIALLCVANGLMHLEQLAMHGLQAAFVPEGGTGQRLGLRVIAAIIVVLGGRVIPMFTRNATGRNDVRSVAIVDHIALAVFAGAVLAEVSSLNPGPTAVLWMLAGALHLARMYAWGTWHARTPLLWILHAGYAATAASFVLEGLAHFGYLAVTSALHMFTVGGIGSLTIGMMARVSLGHSGRRLVVPHFMTGAFGVVVLAALVRAVFPLIFDASVETWWMVSGGLWTVGFILLLVFALPIWISPRADRNRAS